MSSIELPFVMKWLKMQAKMYFSHPIKAAIGHYEKMAETWKLSFVV